MAFFVLALNKNLISKFIEFLVGIVNRIYAAARQQRLVTEMLNLDCHKAMFGTPRSIGREQGTCALPGAALCWPPLSLQINAENSFGERMKA